MTDSRFHEDGNDDDEYYIHWIYEGGECMGKKPVYGEGGYKDPLPCGCIEGQYDCPEARRLWMEAISAYERKEYAAYNKTKMEYEQHRQPPGWKVKP